MAKSRTKNTIRNSYVGIISYTITSIMAFVSRSIFIKLLGMEYLGIGGLYSNILTILSLSDLGINTAMIYALYKPLAENDTEKIKSLIKYFSKLYSIIAGVVTIVGVACIPILPYVIKGSALSQFDLIKYYLLVLTNSVCSYFAISKSTLIRADQHMSIVQLVTYVSTLCVHAVQIILLFLFRNYEAYLIVPIVFTLLGNIVLTMIANKRYPYLKEKQKIVVGDDVKVYIKRNVKSTFIYKLSASIINSTDNILISIILGTVIVGYYNNYYTVISLVNSLISILIQAVTASIGSYYISHTSKEKYMLFKTIMFGLYGLAAFCAASYLSVFSDFIALWLGAEFVLSDFFLVSVVFNNFVICISNPLWMTREAAGLFKDVKYVLFTTAMLNIVFSILLGNLIGLAGIIFATGISRLLTMFWYEPKVLYRKVFETKYRYYWKNIIYLIIACIPSVVVGWALKIFPTQNILIMIGKVVLCGLVTLISFVLIFLKSDELKLIKSKLLKNKLK